VQKFHHKILGTINDLHEKISQNKFHNLTAWLEPHISSVMKNTAQKQFHLLVADEVSHDRDFTRGWNAFVRGDELPGYGSKYFFEGYWKAHKEYGGYTMKNMIEATDSE
jgi:hypothetical protein